MGVFMAIFSAFGFALQNILIRRGLLGKQKGTVNTILLLVLLSSQLSIIAIVLVSGLIHGSIIEEFFYLTWHAVLFLILEGVMGPLIGMFLITTAISQIGASRTSALRSSNPFFAAIFAILFLGESLTALNLMSVFILIAGVVLVSYRTQEEAISLLPKTRVAGALVALLAGLFFALSQIFRGLALDYGATPNTGTLIGGFVALVVLTVICRKEVGSFKFFFNIDRENIYYYLAAGLGTTIGRYALLVAFLYSPVWLAVSLRNSQPIIALVLSWLFLRDTEAINARVAAGTMLVVIAVILLITLK